MLIKVLKLTHEIDDNSKRIPLGSKYVYKEKNDP